MSNPDRDGIFAGCDLQLSPRKQLAFLVLVIVILGTVTLAVHLLK
jgi:hypothetical protein